MRSYGKSGVLDEIRAAGGEVYGVTSEPQRLADRAQGEWELDFECVGDPHQEIRETADERGWLSVFVQTRLEFLRNSPAEFEPAHPKGYFQPGVLVLSRAGRVLYRWRSVPTRKNLGGAMVRPTARHVWAAVQAELHASEHEADVAYDEAPEMDNPPASWPLFVALLVANGWFLRPEAFAQTSTGPSARRRIQNAMARLMIFAALWIAAFATLPTLPVAAVFLGWIGWLLPKLRQLHLEFQKIDDTGPPGSLQTPG